MNTEISFTAACGIDCRKCDIYRAASDPSLAKSIADWFHTVRKIEIKPEDVFCEGCSGTRERHWSPDCWILNCCADKKGLAHCNLCDEFPCEPLENWAKTDLGYMRAFEYLKSLNKN